MKKTMNKTSTLLAAALLTCSATSIAKEMSDAAKLGYSLGYNIGEGMQESFPELDKAALQEGLTAALHGKTPKLEQSERQAVIRAAQQRARAAQQAKMEAQAAENRAAGSAYLNKNQQQEGVQQTASGLQYRVLTKGKGASPKASDTVTVHYHGTLPDGTVFDSSVERNTPATFPLNGVIKGWTEGLQLMREGGKYRFFIPSDLAYGPNGRPPKIGPNQVLIFDVELLEVKD